MSDIYCYPNSDVLINKFNITTEAELYDAEVAFTAFRCNELELNPIKGHFDFNHLKAIHKHIFQDIYSWAGQTRNGDIAKGNSQFCLVQNINSFADYVFSDLYKTCKQFDANTSASNEKKNSFAFALASTWGDVNALHPFREGNGRTQREFFRELAYDCGYVLDLQNRTHKEMVYASTCAFNGNNGPLAKILINSLVPISQYEKKHTNLNILSHDEPLKFKH